MIRLIRESRNMVDLNNGKGEKKMNLQLLAKKKQEQPNMQSQMQQMAVDEQALADIAAIEKQTAMLKQESLNKAHDPELSAYSDFNGTADNENLGVIGVAEIREAYATFEKYKEKKKNLETKLTDYEKFWQLKHWEVVNQQRQNPSVRITPKSAWLVNTILNKHADAMDNYPEPNILPRAADDENTAKILSKIIPVILEQNDYQKTYSDCMWDKNKFGASVTGIFWNNDKNNGLGDIDIKRIDMAQLFWKAGIESIQDSPNVFVVSYMDEEELKARYPGITDTGADPTDTLRHIYYGEDIDETGMVQVVDWYYKRRIKTLDNRGIPMFKQVVHYCKFCNEQVLYASENDPEFAEPGWLSHGDYPFVVDVLLPIKANVVGMGYIDLIADDQLFIDSLQRNILESADWNSRPRSIVNSAGGLNEEEYLDTENAVIHFDGHLGDDSFRQLQPNPLPPIYQNILLEKVQEMKDTSGNTAASQGQNSNVTTASGIASLQEAAGKLSRDSSQQTYRAFKLICHQVIELIRQFYTEGRCFRVTGDYGQDEYVSFDNSGLQPQPQGMIGLPDGSTLDLGNREPILDIDVRPQKKSAYSKETQNQTAINLYQMGFFAPNNGDASMACLEMMDFDGVEKIRDRVARNMTLFNQVQQLSAVLLQIAPEIAVQMGIADPSVLTANQPTGKATGSADKTPGSLSAQAANATRESTTVRS